MDISSENKYFFSFLMICYKQEKYIVRAMESALAQKEPIELIISDDHSPDRTFEIAQEFASHYQGPHKIILNRNPKNLGIGANFCSAAGMAHGEWLFMAAGDDLSLPDRTEKIRDAILRYPKALAFGAPRVIIDTNEKIVGYEDWNKNLHGASAVWHRSVFSKFPAIPPLLNVEDLILYFRVFLLNGEVVLLNTPLIQYRNEGLSQQSSRRDYKIHIPHSIMKLEIGRKALEIRLKDSLTPGLSLPGQTLYALQQRQEEHLLKIDEKLCKLRQKNSYIQLGLLGFWKEYLCRTLEKRPSVRDFLSISSLFFKRPSTHQAASVLSDRNDIVITTERYLNESGMWDF